MRRCPPRPETRAVGKRSDVRFRRAVDAQRGAERAGQVRCAGRHPGLRHHPPPDRLAGPAGRVRRQRGSGPTRAARSRPWPSSPSDGCCCGCWPSGSSPSRCGGWSRRSGASPTSPTAKRRIRKRVTSGCKAVVFAVLAVLSGRTAAGGGGGGGGQQTPPRACSGCPAGNSSWARSGSGSSGGRNRRDRAGLEAEVPGRHGRCPPIPGRQHGGRAHRAGRLHRQGDLDRADRRPRRHGGSPIPSR